MARSLPFYSRELDAALDNIGKRYGVEMNNHFGNSRNDERGAIDLGRCEGFDRRELSVTRPISYDIAFLRGHQRVGQNNNDVTGPG